MTQGRWGGFASRTQGFWAWTVSFDKPGTFLMDLRGWLSCGNQSFVCTHRAFCPKNHMFFLIIFCKQKCFSFAFKRASKAVHFPGASSYPFKIQKETLSLSIFGVEFYAMETVALFGILNSDILWRERERERERGLKLFLKPLKSL